MQILEQQNISQETLKLFSDFHDKKIYCFVCNKNIWLEYLEVDQSKLELTLICNRCKSNVFEIGA